MARIPWRIPVKSQMLFYWCNCSSLSLLIPSIGRLPWTRARRTPKSLLLQHKPAWSRADLRALLGDRCAVWEVPPHSCTTVWEVPPHSLPWGPGQNRILECVCFFVCLFFCSFLLLLFLMLKQRKSEIGTNLAEFQWLLNLHVGIWMFFVTVPSISMYVWTFSW